jgi:hypothetical protein
MSDLAQQLRDLESRRSEIINTISIIEIIVFTNQQTVERKQAQLAQTDAQDETERARLENEISTLQDTIAAESARLVPLVAELAELETEIAALELAAFPEAAAILEPPPPPPPPPGLSSLVTQLITTPVNAAAVLKTGLSTVKIPGLDPGQISGLLSSASAEVEKAKSAVTGAVGQASAALTGPIGKAVSALGGAKAAAAVAKGTAAVSAITALAKAGTTAVTAAQGIGKFGLKPAELEAQGLIKPGAIQAFLTSKPPPTATAADTAEAAKITSAGGAITAAQVAINRQLNEVLASPAIWAGKDQISGIAQIISNTKIQDKLQQTVTKAGLDKVKALGVEVAGTSTEQLGALAQTAAAFGADAAAKWAQGTAPAALAQSMNAVAKNAQQAVSLVNTQLKNFGGIPFNAAGAVGTLDRTSINNAFAKVLGNPKIPVPKFGKAAATSTTAAAIPDNLLVYTGTDPLAWETINAERLNRGLPGLDELGFPNPAATD